MKNRNFLRATVFAVVFCIVFLACDKLFYDNNEVNSTWGKLDNTKIDVLFMGNSHIDTSLDAKVLSDTTGLEIRALSSSAQNMEQTLANLKVLLKYQKPERIVLEVFAVQINNKEEMQTEGLGKMLRNTDGIENYWYKLQSVLQTYWPKNIMTAMFQLTRPIDMWSRWTDFAHNKEYRVDANGFQDRDTYALVTKDMTAFAEEYIERYEQGNKGGMAEYSREAFEEFLAITQENGIEVWIYKGPTTRSSYADTMVTVEEICKDYSHVTYIDDMHREMNTIGLGQDDWYDTGHLNRVGSEKVTRYYGELLAQRMGITLNWDAPFAYYGETAEQTEEGKYRYTMENYSPDCLYKFVLRKNYKALETQEFSENNSFECDIELGTSENYRLDCIMIPKSDATLGEESENKLKYTFMTLNDCVIDK